MDHHENDAIAINATILNVTPDLGETFKLPPIKGSKTSMGNNGLTNNYYKRDRIRMARSFLKAEDNDEIETPSYPAGSKLLDDNYTPWC